VAKIMVEIGKIDRALHVIREARVSVVKLMQNHF
jgi:hypothetical protein